MFRQTMPVRIAIRKKVKIQPRTDIEILCEGLYKEGDKHD